MMRWRPTISLLSQATLRFDTLILLAGSGDFELAQLIQSDGRIVSPTTEIVIVPLDMVDPWDFEEVYSALFDFAQEYPFLRESVEYYAHITTGTHVAQICLFLLVESGVIPGKLIQTSPGMKHDDPAEKARGRYQVIDLDLSRYDKIMARYRARSNKNKSILKSGIETHNARFNKLITEIEHVASHSRDNILLTGPTGAGKTQLAKRVYDLKKASGLVSKAFVELNCATLKGDTAMSALFGHVKGAFSGALADRRGALLEADEGLLFLDEIGELGLDEQAALLRAIEGGVFRPVGADREKSSRFQLICGTNRDLRQEVRLGRFREDLYSRINLWSYRLPSLVERREDISPNLDFEMAEAERRLGRRITMNKDARARYLNFALSDEASWKGNFRDLSASVRRMVTLAHGGRIDLDGVEQEIKRLQNIWGEVEIRPEVSSTFEPGLPRKSEKLQRALDLIQKVGSLSAAARLMPEYREAKNPGDSLRKFLLREGVSLDSIMKP